MKEYAGRNLEGQAGSGWPVTAGGMLGEANTAVPGTDLACLERVHKHNTRVSIGLCKRLSFLSALVLLAGCQTPAPPPLPLTMVTVSNEFDIAAPAPLVAPPVVSPAVSSHEMSWPSNWVTGWIPLEAWGKYNGLENYTLVKSNPHTAIQFPTTNGAMLLKLGTRIASWNGLECWLGWPPQSINGLPCVHWLDARKVLQPLLNPLRLPNTPQRTIVLDPGHGGVDSGAQSAFNSHYEKEYTLDWALRLARLLEGNGWKVILTRDSDKELPLAERTAIADRVKADIFLSLHFNSGLPNRELTGVETYCLTPTGMRSSILRTQEDDLSQSYPNNVYDDQNIQLAVRVHANILAESGAFDRGVRKARFMAVLRGQTRPAILIEGGYLSNDNEARTIANPEYRQRLAEAIARALKA